MGFLKRIFSITSIGGKKKQKKQQAQRQQQLPYEQLQRVHVTLNSDENLQVVDDIEHEAAIGRLLRSSSARFAVVSELDYASLPPLPHPINNVIQTPAASTLSLSSSNTSHRGTYSVQVHKRKRHASTEFPFANRHLDNDFKTPQRTRGATVPPKDTTHFLGLHSDPSVISLLGLYDDHGRLPEKTFSNSPPSPERKEGRAQTRRSGSTLRQLLGAPSNRPRPSSSADSTEGDISWAERFLGESDSVSSLSSTGLRTPVELHAPFADKSLQRPHALNDESLDVSINDPAINSMEVELSISSDSPIDSQSASHGNSPYENANSRSPQRASQVFTFLTQKRRSVLSDEIDRPPTGIPSRPNSELSRVPSRIPATPTPSNSSTSESLRTPTARLTHRPSTYSNVTPKVISDNKDADDDHPDYQGSAHANEVKVLMTGPTKVIVTAPTPSTSRDTPSRIPRGPRVSRNASASNVKQRPLFTERSNSGSSASIRDIYTNLPRKQHRRTASQASSISSLNGAEVPIIGAVEKSKSRDVISKKSSFSSREKENRSALSVRTDLPSTPIRSHSTTTDTRSLFRAIVTPGAYRPPGSIPSPASSSELSPVGQKLMMDVRQQRMRAREAERERNKRRADRYGNAYVA
ncbi:hypothetical protein AMATHDRAFT_46811 [Amanita thiersii Skay4041]|uniref:Uncharacterized protein n=1 Tax=Amanita thiersii Skay4041 TaxID=703135 RepID=A0A2A9NU91_9AGAR|nr:hypothetical protein AMATHDRAFT_46811 [Amanita thiersii Skay4041]